jgi:hypothetical protein
VNGGINSPRYSPPPITYGRSAAASSFRGIVGRNGVGFDPRAVAGSDATGRSYVSAWWDFSDPSSVFCDASGLIQRLNDKSGNGWTMTQGTASNRPSLGRLGGLQCADYGTASSDKALVSSMTTNTNAREVAIVCCYDQSASMVFASSVFSQNTGAALWGQGRTWNPGGGGFYSDVSQNGWTTTSPYASMPNAFPSLRDPCVVQAWNLVDINARTAVIGQNVGVSGRNWRGRIGEVITFSIVLTAFQRESVRIGLARKWRCPL